MGSFAAGLLEGLRSAYCSHIAGQKEWVKNLRRLMPFPAVKDSADFLIQMVCDRPPEPTDYPPPPFTGGQCPKSYRVTVVYQDSIKNVAGVWSPRAFSATRTCTGPILGLGPRTSTDSVLSILTATGNVSTGLTLTPFACQVNPEYYKDCRAHISDISTTDGSPDECGDPTYDPGDYSPTNINLDLDVNYGPTNNFNVTIPVVIAPVYVAFDGSVNVPVTFDISPEISLEGTWTLFPDAKLELNFPTSPTEEPPGSTGDDDPPPEDPGGDDPGGGSEDDPDAPGKPEEPEEPEERIHFLIVRAVVNSEARPSTVHQNVAPSLYVPRLGSARFGATVDGVTFWTSDIDIKGLNSIVECPIPWGATRFAVDAAPGVALNYAPVSTDPQAWPQYLQIGTTYTDDRR